MNLLQLKEKLHASIDKLNNEEALQEVAEVLDMYNGQTQNDFEFTAEFNSQLDEAIREANNENLYANEDAVEWLKQRKWRSK